MTTSAATTYAEAEIGTNDSNARLAGKYMTFKLADEEYGLEILRVIEIIGVMDITSVPRSQEFIRGIINLRGKVIPVADLRLLFGMEKVEATDQTVIIVVQLAREDREITMGILVDQVMEVLDIPAQQIEPPPNLGKTTTDSGFILGVGKADTRVIFLLDIGRILNTDDRSALLAATQTGQAA